VLAAGRALGPGLGFCCGPWPEPCGIPSGAGALAAAANSPLHTQTYREFPWQNVAGGPGARGPGSGRYWAREQNGENIMTAANPKLQRLAQLAPSWQALIAARWWESAGVLALCFHGTQRPERCGPRYRMDFQAAPALRVHGSQAGPLEDLLTLGLDLK